MKFMKSVILVRKLEDVQPSKQSQVDRCRELSEIKKVGEGVRDANRVPCLVKAIMAIPHAALAAGWIPFFITIILIVLFSFVYVRYFQSKYESEVCSTLVAISGLVVAMITTALLPVDIFLVSFMKYSNGTFKDWASSPEDRKGLEHMVTYGYYALYACVILWMFFILPFAYFFYEEDDTERSRSSRLCTAVKYTCGFVFVATVLMLIGAFAPLQFSPNVNSTEWERIKDLFKELGKNHGEDSIAFTISIMTLLGMIMFIIYSGYGMSAWPMDLVKGRRSLNRERLEVVRNRGDVHARIVAIRAKYAAGQVMSDRDRNELEELQDQEHLMSRREDQLDAADKSLFRKCGIVLRPFEILLGVICFLMALLIFMSLLLTNIDKAIHSLGWRYGYVLPESHLPNPIDIVLVFSQKVFPIDYILMAFMIMYFLFCSMGGIQHIGIWCFCVRMYKIRPRRTKPQGLLFLVFILMLVVLALNVIVYQVTPQYSTFGSQHFVTYVNETVGNKTEHIPKLVPCNFSAPADECVMTSVSLLLKKFFYRVWFFGACYYYASWVLLGVFLIGFLVTLIKKRRSAIEGSVDRDDIESDDEALVDA